MLVQNVAKLQIGWNDGGERADMTILSRENRRWCKSKMNEQREQNFCPEGRHSSDPWAWHFYGHQDSPVKHQWKGPKLVSRGEGSSGSGLTTLCSRRQNQPIHGGGTSKFSWPLVQIASSVNSLASEPPDWLSYLGLTHKEKLCWFCQQECFILNNRLFIL